MGHLELPSCYANKPVTSSERCKYMKSIAIITARGGSKRIPRKNIKPFLGKPIIEYSIEAALESGCFDEVMVSTDDEEIASIARNAGAKVPFLRSEATSNDYATTADVILEVLDRYAEQGREYDYCCCIYPTAPFVTAGKLKDAMQRLTQSDADGLVPVVNFSYPPQRAFVIEEDALIFKYPEYMNSRSQDLPKHYHDVGQFYMLKTDSFRESHKLFGGKVLPLIVSELEVQDIDNETDWQLAELKYQYMEGRK